MNSYALLTLLSFFYVVQAQSCNRVTVRKEWRTLSTSQKRDYTQAIVKMQQTTSGQDSVAFYAEIHNRLGNSGIHQSAHFLPWHRHVTLLYEQALIRKNPQTAAHYWDASLDHQDYWGAPLFEPSDAGFGTLGKGSKGCVTDGAFKNFKPSPFGCLTRATTRGATLSSPAIVNALISNNNDFWSFAEKFEDGFHGEVHAKAGGIMLESFLSPYEPLFFIHHSNVDRVWAIWQAQSPSRLLEFRGQSTQFARLERLDSVILGFESTRVTVRSVMNIATLCYTYDDLSLPNANQRSGNNPVTTTPGNRQTGGNRDDNRGRDQNNRGNNNWNNNRGNNNWDNNRGNNNWDNNRGNNNGRNRDQDFRGDRRDDSPRRGRFGPGRGRNPSWDEGRFLERRSLILNDTADFGEIVAIRYPTPLPDMYIKMHGYNEAKIRSLEAENRRIVDQLNALPGYESPSCIGQRKNALVRKINENPAKEYVFKIHGQSCKVKARQTAEETADEIRELVDQELNKHQKPTVQQLVKIIGKPCFSSKSLYNPFNACQK